MFLNTATISDGDFVNAVLSVVLYPLPYVPPASFSSFVVDQVQFVICLPLLVQVTLRTAEVYLNFYVCDWMKLKQKDDAVQFGGVTKSVPVGVNHPVGLRSFFIRSDEMSV